MPDLLNAFAAFVFIIAIPIAVGFAWGAGYAFRSAVLKHDLDKGNKYFQFAFKVLIGAFILVIISVVTKKLGMSGDDAYYR